VRWYDGSSTQSVPVFNTGSSGSDVEEVVRIQTKNGLAFVPIAATGYAAFPERRLQHNGNTLAWHDSQSAIPDSGDYQWYIDEGSGSTLNPDVGNVSATINGPSWVSDASAVGGFALDLSGSGDSWSTDLAVLTEPLTICGWFNFDDMTAFDNTIFSIDGSNNGWYLASNGSGELVFADEVNSPSTPGGIEGTPFPTAGNWGFFGFNYGGGSARLITFDNSQELADNTASVSRNISAATLYCGIARNITSTDGQCDFYVVSEGSQLSKTDITELWQATQR